MALHAQLNWMPSRARRALSAVTSQRRYSKFVIVARSRTGSNLLVGLLGSHPNIVCRGEEFRELAGRSSSAVWNGIFDRRPLGISHVGFKLFYYHPIDSSDRSVWNFVAADPSIRIVHLIRRNLLRTALSRAIAERTDVWDDRIGRGQKIDLSDRRVRLDAEECIRDFERTRGWATQLKADHPSHRIHEVEYETLVSDPRAIIEIQRFLGVRRIRDDLQTDHRRQNREALGELITNYAEFSHDLRQTEWAYLLDLEPT